MGRHNHLDDPPTSMRRRSFRNSTWRDGDSADSGSSKMNSPCRRQRSSKKRRKPSPWGVCEIVGWRAAESSSGRVVEVARDGEEALGAEEPAVGQLRQPCGAKRIGEPAAVGRQRAVVLGRPVALAATGTVIAGERGDRLEQRRLPRAVLADDDGDRPIEGEVEPSRARTAARRDSYWRRPPAPDRARPVSGRAVAERYVCGRGPRWLPP